MWYESLPHLNVALNATSAVLLSAGYAAIRRKAQGLHARLMVSAFASSTLFLASYITYHLLAGHKAYAGEGWLRAVYLTILFSHIGLAVLILPLSLTTLFFALQKRFDRHRKIARWTLPLWVYVSVTGVVVYLMLYHGSSQGSR
jgi:putative membrane protein